MEDQPTSEGDQEMDGRRQAVSQMKGKAGQRHQPQEQASDISNDAHDHPEAKDGGDKRDGRRKALRRTSPTGNHWLSMKCAPSSMGRSLGRRIISGSDLMVLAIIRVASPGMQLYESPLLDAALLETNSFLRHGSFSFLHSGVKNASRTDPRSYRHVFGPIQH